MAIVIVVVVVVVVRRYLVKNLIVVIINFMRWFFSFMVLLHMVVDRKNIASLPNCEICCLRAALESKP